MNYLHALEQAHHTLELVPSTMAEAIYLVGGVVTGLSDRSAELLVVATDPEACLRATLTRCLEVPPARRTFLLPHIVTPGEFVRMAAHHPAYGLAVNREAIMLTGTDIRGLGPAHPLESLRDDWRRHIILGGVRLYALLYESMVAPTSRLRLRWRESVLRFLRYAVSFLCNGHISYTHDVLTVAESFLGPSVQVVADYPSDPAATFSSLTHLIDCVLTKLPANQTGPSVTPIRTDQPAVITLGRWHSSRTERLPGEDRLQVKAWLVPKGSLPDYAGMARGHIASPADLVLPEPLVGSLQQVAPLATAWTEGKPPAVEAVAGQREALQQLSLQQASWRCYYLRWAVTGDARRLAVSWAAAATASAVLAGRPLVPMEPGVASAAAYLSSQSPDPVEAVSTWEKRMNEPHFNQQSPCLE